MKIFGLLFLTTLVLLTTCNTITSAQDKDTSYKYWFTIGIGLWPKQDMSFNISYSFSPNFNFLSEDNFFKVGYFTRGGFSLSGNLNVGHDDFLYRTFDLSIGKRLLSEWFTTCFFLGPSYVFGKKRITRGNYEKFGTFGLEYDIQLLFRPANEIGIGFGLYGNFNFANIYSGININITFGNAK